MKDLYAVLEVPRDADPEAIETAYRRRARKTHPDVGGSEEEFHAVDLAYRVLKDPNRRATYDETGQHDGAQPDNKHADAMMVISFYLMKTITCLPQTGKEPKTADIKAILKEVFAGVVQEIAKSKKAKQKIIDDLKITADRFSVKEGPNLIAEMLKFNIDQSEQELLKYEAEKVKINNALEFLEHYEYRVDKVDRGLFMPGSWRNSGSAYGFSAFAQPRGFFGMDLGSEDDE